LDHLAKEINKGKSNQEGKMYFIHPLGMPGRASEFRSGIVETKNPNQIGNII